MKYKTMVKYGGKYYAAGEEVPEIVPGSAPEEVPEDVGQEPAPADEPVKQTGTKKDKK